MDSVFPDMDSFYDSANKPLFDYVVSHSGFDDNDVVFEYYGIKTTFRTFKSYVSQIADILIGFKLNPRDKVVISLITTPESVCLLYACDLLGLTPVMADVRLSPSELVTLVNDVGASLLFVSDFNTPDPVLLTSPESLKKVIVVSPCDGLQGFFRFSETFPLFYPVTLIVFILKPWKNYVSGTIYSSLIRIIGPFLKEPAFLAMRFSSQQAARQEKESLFGSLRPSLT